MKVIGGLARRVRSVLSDPAMIRRVTYGVAAVAAVLSLTAAVNETETSSSWAALFIPLAAILALPNRAWRAVILGAGGGLVNLWTPDAVWLWPGVAGMVFVSIAEDLREVPRAAWICGFAGAVGSVLLFPQGNVVAPFLAVLAGGGAAMLLRTRVLAGELARETRALRHQTQWLEQRTNLARELHDVVGHHVTAIVVQAEAGQVGDPQAALRTIGDLGRSALGDLDALVVHLRDPESPLLVSAPPRLGDIDELLAGSLRRHGVDVSVRIEPDLGLDEVGVLTVYRIAQEALTNVTRHAKASAAWVEITRTGRNVRLRVSDDGIGPPVDPPERGAGLVGIEERVNAVGGMWALSERPGGGTMVDAFLPVTDP